MMFDTKGFMWMICLLFVVNCLIGFAAGLAIGYVIWG